MAKFRDILDYYRPYREAAIFSIAASSIFEIIDVDKIVVLDQGRIVEVGSHTELLHREGIYRRLHSLQETGELLD